MIATARWGNPTSVAWEDHDSGALLHEETCSRRKRQPIVQPVDTEATRYRIVQHKVNGYGWHGPGQAGTASFSIACRDRLAKTAGSVHQGTRRKDPVMVAVLERLFGDLVSSPPSADVGRMRVKSGGGRVASTSQSRILTEKAWSRFAQSCLFEGTWQRTPGHDAVRPLPESPDSSTEVSARQNAIQTVEGYRDVPWCAEVGQALLSARHLADDAAKLVASAAIEDAHTLARSMALPPPKSTNVSEEGLVSLVWENTTHALLIVFTGDGEGSFSVKKRDDLFVTITDFIVADGLPVAASSVLGLQSAP